VPSLYNKDTGALIGRISAEQLEDLIDFLVEESADDRDYYIDQTTLDFLSEQGADEALIALIAAHLPAGEEGIEIEWREDDGRVD
jgi:hypothetical protein